VLLLGVTALGVCALGLLGALGLPSAEAATLPGALTGQLSANWTGNGNEHICTGSDPSTHNCYPDGPQDTSDIWIKSDQEGLTFKNLKFKGGSPGGYTLTGGTGKVTESSTYAWTYYDTLTDPQNPTLRTCNYSSTVSGSGTATGTVVFDSTSSPHTAYVNPRVPAVITYSNFSGDCMQYNMPSPTTAHVTRSVYVPGTWNPSTKTITINYTSTPAEYQGGTWKSNGTLRGETYKISFYSFGVHGFVQFRAPNAPPLTYGKFATSPWLLSDIKTQVAALFILPGTRMPNGPSPWEYRITYEVTKDQYDAGLKYANNPATWMVYNLLSANCVNWLQGVAQAAGLQLPDFTDNSTPLDTQLAGAGPAIGAADGHGMTLALQDIGDGGTFAGGTVMRSTGGSADGSPDPPFPPDAGSPGPLARAALANPAGTARTFKFQYETINLGTAHTDGDLQVRDTPSRDPAATLTSIDWGDGSASIYSIQEHPLQQGAVTVLHHYASAGTFTDRIVIVEDGKLVSLTGTVIVGAAGPGLQSFTVPAPGPQVAYGTIAWPVALRASPHRVHRRGSARFSVRISSKEPRHVARLEVYRQGQWHVLKTGRLSRSSKWKVSVRVTASGFYRVEVVVGPGTAGEYSAPVAVAVR
jgi:hypothetical protein